MTHVAPSYHDNANQRTPCMLVLDVSKSMRKQHVAGGRRRIDELNDGLRVLRDCLRDDVTALYKVQLAIIAVGGPGNMAQLHTDWTDAADFEAPELEADGNTPLGEGMRLALWHVEQQKRKLRDEGIPYTRPWIMVISDGEPTDADSVWRSVARDCMESEARKRCIIYPIGVEGAKLEVLQQLSHTPAKMLSAARFSQYFRWLSASMSKVSNSSDGDPVVLDASSPWEATGSGVIGKR